MDVLIKRIDDSLPLPAYQTDGSVFFDLAARETIEIAPQSTGLIPLNIVVATPEGYLFLLVPRSSTPLKKGLLIPNGIGVIDQDYCGNGDEVRLLAYNFSRETVTIERGERIAQAGFVRVDRANWREVESMPGANRGGFGSTG
ncbi:MAG: dUTP diphosphatase [Anaerolineae bacterium]|nr:dUTP diphosphatase [Anaerolineae bacterium]